MMKISHMDDFGLSTARIALFLILALSAALLEGFGIAMFLPVLEYIESGQTPARLAETSGMWRYLVTAFSKAGLTVDLFSLLSVVLAIMVLRVCLFYTRQCYTAWLTQEILHCTRTNLLKAVLEADYSLFDRSSTGGIVNLAATETPRVGGFFGSLFVLFANCVVIGAYIVLLLFMSVRMTVVALVLLGVGSACVVWLVRHTRKLSRETTDANQAFSFSMIERITAVRLIKLSAVVKREIERMTTVSKRVRDNVYALAELSARVDLALEPVVILMGLSIIYAAVKMFDFSLAQVGVFMVVLSRLLPLSKELLRSYQTMGANNASVAAVRKGIDDARNSPEEIACGVRRFDGVESTIEFRDVSFAYSAGSRPALHRVNLVLRAGRTTALVGPSGAGKSTLVDLLPRLRRHQQGAIYYDGVEDREFSLDSLRRGIAFVSQDAAIVNDTVRNNLIFACTNAPADQNIWQVLERVRAAEFVRQLPKGLDTVLGERGLLLSGGQRQRLSLSRALLQNAPVLILDEPTSALDSEVEKDIRAALDQMHRDGKKTVIIIAHRLSTIRNADSIVVLKGGRVQEQGSHRELILSKEWYARVSGMQDSDAFESEGNNSHRDV